MASFIMAGRMQAAIFVVLSTLISLVLLPPIIIFNNAAIALITLRKGWQQGVAYAALAVTTFVLVSIVLKQSVGSGVVFGLASWLPIVLIASALAVTNSWGKTLQLTLILSVAGVTLFHLMVPDASAFWKPIMEQVKPLLQQAYQLDENVIDKALNNAASWMTGGTATIFAMIAILSLIVARNWQSRLYNPGGFGEEFRKIRLGKQTSIAMVVGIAIAFVTGNHLIIELIMVGVGVFMFQGLSLAHALVKQREMNNLWLVGIYVLLLLLFIQMIVLFSAFGIIDNFVDFRKKVENIK